MPILAGFLMSAFTGIFNIIIKKFTVNTAVSLAYIATIGGAYLAVKSAVFGLGFLAGIILPQPLVYVFSLVLPSSIPALVTTLWVADATLSGWAWFQHRIPVLAQLAKV
jgi:hypothetical protein